MLPTRKRQDYGYGQESTAVLAELTLSAIWDVDVVQITRYGYVYITY